MTLDMINGILIVLNGSLGAYWLSAAAEERDAVLVPMGVLAAGAAILLMSAQS